MTGQSVFRTGFSKVRMPGANIGLQTYQDCVMINFIVSVSKSQIRFMLTEDVQNLIDQATLLIESKVTFYSGKIAST